MRQIMGRVGAAVVSLAIFAVAWLGLYEVLSYGWRA
jgi:hypothetical protein